MAARKEKKLDIAKLQKMQEPITVQVYRIKQNNKIPISLPSKIEGPPGTGWGCDDVLQLEEWVRVNGGGGYYTAEATDANGVAIEWLFGWDPRAIPELSPGGQMPSPMPVPAPMMSQPQMPYVSPQMAAAMDPTNALGMRGNTDWLQQFSPPQYPQQVYPPQPQPQMPWGMYGGANPMTNPMMWQQGQSTSTPRNGSNDRERDLESQLRQTQMAQQQAQYQQQMDRIQMSHQQELAGLRDEMRRSAETKRPGESDEVKLLREQLTETKREQQLSQMQHQTQAQIDKLAELITKVAEGGNNRGESDQIRELKEQQRRAEEQAERREADRRHREEMAAIRAEMAGSKTDPMLEFMKESSRQQIEAQKEMSRNQRETAQITTGMMVNPVQMMEMMQRQSGQSDAVTKQLIENFGAGFETYRMMMESLMQMQGGGSSPGMTMLSEGLQKAGEIANGYISAQRDKAVHEARAKAQTASAQAQTAQAYRAQAEATARTTPRTYDEDMLAGQQTPAAAASSGAGLSGASPVADADSPPADVINLNDRRPPSEAEMFGTPEVLEAVTHLREGVKAGSLDPSGAVNALLQGIAMCEQQKIIVPAFTLFAEGRFADLLDALLPKAPQSYRDTCVQILANQFLDDGEDDEEDESPPG